MELYTLKGSKISRYKDNVGKHIGGKVYAHRQYMCEIVPAQYLMPILGWLSNTFKFTTFVYDLKDHSIRFDEAPNFDNLREPWAAWYIKIRQDGQITYGHTDAIWHHKWLWVKDDYTKFDVKKSYNWSRKWLGRITSPSGSMRVWKQQLEKAGLR